MSSRSPEDDKQHQPSPDVPNDDEFFRSEQQVTESSMDDVDYDLQLHESLLDEEEEAEDVNGEELMEIDGEDGQLDEIDSIDGLQEEEDDGLNLEDIPGDIGEEDDGLDSDRSSDIEDENEEAEEDDDEEGNEEDEEREDSDEEEEEQEVRIRPLRSKRLRRSGEHHAGEDSKSVACRLPTNLEIREGHEYQVHVDEFVEDQNSDDSNREKCVWKPMHDAKSEDIDEYCDYCEARFAMHRDRSLFILRMAGYDFEKAKQKCETRAVIHDEWSEDDKWLFEQCITNFGKNFSKIRNAMPNKSVSALVQYYYNTKKGVNYKSFFDVDNVLIDEVSSDESGDEEVLSKETHSETKEETPEPDVLDEGVEIVEENVDADSDTEEVICTNCQEYVKQLHDMDEFKLCTTCFFYLKATNMMRPSQDLTSRKKIKLPEDMVDVVEEFHQLALKAEEPMYDIEGDDDDEVRVYSKCTYVVDEELRSVQRQLQEVQRKLAVLHAKSEASDFDFANSAEVFEFRKIAASRPVLSETSKVWTEREMAIAFHSLTLYKNDYSRAAALIRTKNESQIKEFISRHTEDLENFAASTSTGAESSTEEESPEALEEQMNGEVDHVEGKCPSPAVQIADESSEESDHDDSGDDSDDVSRSPSLEAAEVPLPEFSEHKENDDIIAI